MWGGGSLLLMVSRTKEDMRLLNFWFSSAVIVNSPEMYLIKSLSHGLPCLRYTSLVELFLANQGEILSKESHFGCENVYALYYSQNTPKS